MSSDPENINLSPPPESTNQPLSQSDQSDNEPKEVQIPKNEKKPLKISGPDGVQIDIKSLTKSKPKQFENVVDKEDILKKNAPLPKSIMQAPVFTPRSMKNVGNFSYEKASEDSIEGSVKEQKFTSPFNSHGNFKVPAPFVDNKNYSFQGPSVAHHANFVPKIDTAGFNSPNFIADDSSQNSPSTNPIAPPKFTGRTGVKNVQNNQSNVGLSPREKLTRGAASAGAKVLNHTSPFGKDSEGEFTGLPQSNLKQEGQWQHDKYYSTQVVEDVNEKVEDNFTKTNGKVNKGDQSTEVLNKLKSMFSPEQALAIQAAIKSMLEVPSDDSKKDKNTTTVEQTAACMEAVLKVSDDVATKKLKDQNNSDSGISQNQNVEYMEKEKAHLDNFEIYQKNFKEQKQFYNLSANGSYGAAGVMFDKYDPNYKPKTFPTQNSQTKNQALHPPPGLSQYSHPEKSYIHSQYQMIGGTTHHGVPSYMMPNVYSRKVFVGGLPPDIDEDEIRNHFSKYGKLSVDWPHKAESKSIFPPKGYAFLIFHSETSVGKLVNQCFSHDDKLYIAVNSPTIKDKNVQIRPWLISDSDYVMDQSEHLDPRKTIFVGGVPRPLKASELAKVMNDYYGNVCYAGIDTDPELKYPKGAGRVAFSNQQSYIAAISARFVQLQYKRDIDKRVEVKPYVLDDQLCDECQGGRNGGKFAPYFCANITCLQYYCENCWKIIHSEPSRNFHKPLVKEGADRNALIANFNNNIMPGMMNGTMQTTKNREATFDNERYENRRRSLTRDEYQKQPMSRHQKPYNDHYKDQYNRTTTTRSGNFGPSPHHHTKFQFKPDRQSPSYDHFPPTPTNNKNSLGNSISPISSTSGPSPRNRNVPNYSSFNPNNRHSIQYDNRNYRHSSKGHDDHESISDVEKDYQPLSLQQAAAAAAHWQKQQRRDGRDDKKFQGQVKNLSSWDGHRPSSRQETNQSYRLSPSDQSYDRMASTDNTFGRWKMKQGSNNGWTNYEEGERGERMNSSGTGGWGQNVNCGKINVDQSTGWDDVKIDKDKNNKNISGSESGKSMILNNHIKNDEIEMIPDDGGWSNNRNENIGWPRGNNVKNVNNGWNDYKKY